MQLGGTVCCTAAAALTSCRPGIEWAMQMTKKIEEKRSRLQQEKEKGKEFHARRPGFYVCLFTIQSTEQKSRTKSALSLHTE
jgi:hypothetical protein